MDSATNSDFTTEYLARSEAAMRDFRADPAVRAALPALAGAIAGSLRQGGKLLVAGNGGSAGDAQHIAGEFISRLMYDRAPMAAIALTTDSSVLTASGNDYGFHTVFARQVAGLGRPGDVFLGISTSGRSPNVIAALDEARARGLVTMGFCGADPADMGARCDLVLAVPSQSTPIIQQLHIIAAHIVCALVERAIFPPANAPDR
jgi:D-sedoheptulose 7-phosphate isomerase